MPKEQVVNERSDNPHPHPNPSNPPPPPFNIYLLNTHVVHTSYSVHIQVNENETPWIVAIWYVHKTVQYYLDLDA